MEKNRTELSRGKNREVKDVNEVYRILDEGLVCHLSFIRDGYPVVLPTNYARKQNQIILHGGNESPFYQAIAAADSICLCVTLLDGLVLAKSAYSHSVNYRSVVIFGKARIVEDPDEKVESLKYLVNHVLKNRWESVRPPSEKEVSATMVLSVPIAEYSAKSRAGDPMVMSSDINNPVWSGILPLALKAGAPVSDSLSMELIPDTEIQNYDRRSYRSL